MQFPRIAVWLVLFHLLIGVGAVYAQPAAPYSVISPSLVYVEIKYLSKKEGPTYGTEITSQGTGFFVHPDGTIISSYHLVEGLVADNGIDVSIKITVGGAPDQQGSEELDGALVDFSKAYDLLLLKIRPSEQSPPRPVTLGRSNMADESTDLYTSGYNGTEPFRLTGRVASQLGPLGVGYLWSLQMSVSAGQSGSPVYLKDGTVIGVLKGSKTSADGIGYMVPIDYADNMLPWLRIAQLEREVAMLKAALGSPVEPASRTLTDRIAKLEEGMHDVSGYYDWQADFQADRLIASYSKILAGDPLVHTVAYQVYPIVEYTSGRIARGERLDDGVVPAAKSEGKGGFFTIDDLGQLLRQARVVQPLIKTIPEVEIRVNAVTTEGDALPPRVIRVDSRAVMQP